MRDPVSRDTVMKAQYAAGLIKTRRSGWRAGDKLPRPKVMADLEVSTNTAGKIIHLLIDEKLLERTGETSPAQVAAGAEARAEQAKTHLASLQAKTDTERIDELCESVQVLAARVDALEAERGEVKALAE